MSETLTVNNEPNSEVLSAEEQDSLQLGEEMQAEQEEAEENSVRCVAPAGGAGGVFDVTGKNNRKVINNYRFQDFFISLVSLSMPSACFS